MVIPLGIMDAPFYDPDASYYANLGGIGAVIGHEISHAFDYSGMQYDASGNFDPDWMPASDIEAFASVSSSFVEYYSSYTVMTYHNVDGDLTITENMADAAGLECVLRLAPSLSEKQEIFENYAKIFASVTTREAMLDQIATDAHSPDMVRINANVALFDEFYEIYDVNEGDLMYVAPSDRVRRW
jgi:predicted metalloendopeptidase